MHEFRNVAIILDVHGHLLAFLHAQQRSRGAAVVSNGLDYLLW